ncbi:T9SS type A sorting domain-containing protein [Flavobacterium sp. RHBU_24]|uniref:T9SS type A sorting domain-containing protein n=1 Tax=Flavobacterium sp. RHBU_24 TaxID=3391185 RepID=UPI003984A488
MKKKLLLLLPLLLLSQYGEAQCADVQNVFAFIYDGKTYEIIKENKTWVNAAACAVSRGGYLAEVNSIEENNAIFNQLAQAGVSAADTPASDGFSSYVWLGGNDISGEGNWIWNGNNDTTTTAFWQGTFTGSAVNGHFNNWGNNEPDNWGTGTGQDGLGMAVVAFPNGPAGSWNDVKHTNVLYFVVEYSTILGSGIAANATVSVYPNPATDIVKISAAVPVKAVTLYTLTGQVVQPLHKDNWANGEISVVNLNAGIYIMNIFLEDDTVVIKKLVKD